MSDPDLRDSDDTPAEAIQKLIAGIKSGQITAAIIRVKLTDGSTQNVQFGYITEEEKDLAMAKLLKLLNELQ